VVLGVPDLLPEDPRQQSSESVMPPAVHTAEGAL